VRYSIYSGDPDGYFSIDPLTGTIRTASALDHEAHQSVLLNVQAMSGDPPAYGHTQVSGYESPTVSVCQQLSGCESPTVSACQQLSGCESPTVSACQQLSGFESSTVSACRQL